MNPEEICKQVNHLAKDVGQFIKGEVRNIDHNDIKQKGIHDFVTYVDKTSEERLVSKLRDILPEAGFITEENSLLERSDNYNWIIDPLDGTTNFIHSIPFYSISIALMHQNEIILGVVYEVNSKELFYSWKGEKAYLNGVVIKVSSSKKMDDSLIATGFPFHDFSKLDAYLNTIRFIMQNSCGVRRLGSAALDLAYVACGRFDAFFEYGLHPWDVAAGSFIVKQAGGKVTDFIGGDEYVFSRKIIASNNGIYKELLDLIEKYF